MSDFPAGGKIYKNLIEYPLPDVDGVQDVVVNTVPLTDNFGMASRDFFNNFYSTYFYIGATSLEGVIRQIYDEVMAPPREVTSIREIAIIAHASAKGIKLPVLANISGPDQAIYQFITPKSLMQLQKDFLAGKFADFNNKRKAVIKYLTKESWITIRCCNFGQNTDGLYALYSFFGGLANVYAPKVYQYFGTVPISLRSISIDPVTQTKAFHDVPLRFGNHLMVHDHLVRQRFFPKDNHTPDRKDKVVESLINPGKFSEPFELARKNTGDTTSAEALVYDALITALNAKTISPYLIQQFDQAGFTLTAGAAVTNDLDNFNWKIYDIVTHEQVDYKIIYYISADLPVSGSVSITADAQMADMYSAKESIPLQLFLNETEHREFGGWLFFLATYSDQQGEPPETRATFEATLLLLNHNQFKDGSAGGVNIKDFFTGQYTLTDAATISLLFAGDENEPRTWLITDTVSYVIKLEEDVVSDVGVSVFGLSAYRHFSAADETIARYNLVSSRCFGKDPDLPGTELLAYLDRQPFDDLLNFIDFLRAPYLEQEVCYLHHAQEALQRKKEFSAWYQTSGEKAEAETDAIVNGGYTNLSLREWDDNLSLVYLFNTNLCWAEVKASNPSATVIQQDLFTEELFHFDNMPPDVSSISARSPAQNITNLRNSESQMYPKAFLRDKIVIRPRARRDLTCKEFTDLVNKIKALGTKKTTEIIAAMGDYKVEEDVSLLDYLTEDYGFASFKLVWELMENFEVYAESHSAFAEILGGIVEARAAIFVSLSFAIIEVFIMLLHLAEAEQTAVENWEREGKIVALRQWALMLQGLAQTAGYHFQDKITIDPETGSVEPYYINRYRLEYQEYWHQAAFPNIPYPTELKKGFDEAWKEIEKVGNEILSETGEIFDAALMKAGLEACKINALRSSGLIDMDQVKRMIMLQLSKFIMDTSPNP
jgi:hypothetical protein